MMHPISPRVVFVLLLAALNAPMWPAHAGRCAEARAHAARGPEAPAVAAGLPQRTVIAAGVVIARGNELAPPFTLAIEADSLCIYDGAGRRFASSAALEQASPADGSGLPVPRLLASVAESEREAAPAVSPELRMAQIAHLLRAGGALAFGDAYLVAFPPASAAEVLPDLRWIAEHAVHLSGKLPSTNPFFRDLMWPARLAPPGPDPG